nr:hypothetical protein GCM10017745_44850 [Saccharothrix mutabilis subsp. capreolus]
MATRYYKPDARATLAAFSAGTRYWPGCGEQLLRWEKGKYWIGLDIAHICALNPAGPRYNPAMSDQQRNDFPTLICLCRLHHRIVDEGDGSAYPVALLREWKTERETEGQQRLRAQSPVTRKRPASCGSCETRWRKPVAAAPSSTWTPRRCSAEPPTCFRACPTARSR